MSDENNKKGTAYFSTNKIDNKNVHNKIGDDEFGLYANKTFRLANKYFCVFVIDKNTFLKFACNFPEILAMNLAFCCELYLKGFIALQTHKVNNNGHNLEKLIALLGIKFKEDLKDKVSRNNDLSKNFDLVIHELSDSFEFYRYINEFKIASIELQNLVDLTIGLHDVLVEKNLI